MIRKDTDMMGVWASTFEVEGACTGIVIGLRNKELKKDYPVASLEYNANNNKMVLVLNTEMLVKTDCDIKLLNDAKFHMKNES